MNRVLVALLTSACATGLFTSDASAQEWYAGFGGRQVFVDWKGAENSHAQSAVGLTGLFGVRSTHLGLELAYSNDFADFGVAQSEVNLTAGHLSIRSTTLSGIAFWPLGNNGWFQPFVTAGASYRSANERTILAWKVPNSNNGATSYEHHRQVTPNFSASELSWRAGLGAQARVSRDISLRFSASYEPSDFGGHSGGAASFALFVISKI